MQSMGKLNFVFSKLYNCPYTVSPGYLHVTSTCVYNVMCSVCRVQYTACVSISKSLEKLENDSNAVMMNLASIFIFSLVVDSSLKQYIFKLKYTHIIFTLRKMKYCTHLAMYTSSLVYIHGLSANKLLFTVHKLVKGSVLALSLPFSSFL